MKLRKRWRKPLNFRQHLQSLLLIQVLESKARNLREKKIIFEISTVRLLTRFQATPQV